MTNQQQSPAASSGRAGVLDILSGGGEIGSLARALDWRQTAVGPVESWPQSLRTAVSMLLESRFPMLLCWGAEFIQFYNDPFRPILGQKKHPALGKSTRETFAEAWHIIGPLFEQVMRGSAVGFEDMLVPLDRNGFLEECYFLYSYSPIRDESGGVGGILVTCTETTARVLAERRLRTLRELASQAAQAQAEAGAWASAAQVLAANPADLPFVQIYALDRDGSTARLATRGETAWGPPEIRAGDAVAPWPLFPAGPALEPQILTDVRARCGDHAGPAWPESVAAAMVLPVVRPGLAQPYGYLVAGISPRLALDDRYRDFLTLVADQIATALANARAYEEERRRTEALLELDRQKTAFFSNVSHEFRTPLTLLLGPLEEALARSPQALAPAELELVHRNALRLLRLVNSLLDFSRIEAGRASAAFEETDLAALTRDLASTFRSLMEQAGLAFEIDCPPLQSRAVVDRAMWEKIVLNLLSNAFKFTLNGRVRLSLREARSRIELQVEDTGAGIPAGHLPRVFDRFHRVEGTPSRTFEGSGIGLALVRELVRMHGGEVTVESVESRGSTFTVSIPADLAPSQPAFPPAIGRAAASPAAPYIEEAHRWTEDARPPATAAPTGAPEAQHGSAARILVVDDNADMRAYLHRLLSARWNVELAANGREALARIAAMPPDLVVTDVMMPEVDGFELLRRVRAGSGRLPIIMLSARSGEESRIEGLTAGADDYIIKPFPAQELIARVATQLEMARLRRELTAQNERLRSLIDLAPAAIAVVRGPEHVYEFANELYRELVGRHDIIGKPGREALPELVGQGIWDLLDRVYATREPYAVREFRAMLDRRGTGALDEGFFNFALQPLTDARGAAEGVLIHAIEVTEQVVARRSLDEARASAESANRAKDEFLAMLGHELRNPLAPILTALQLMTLRGDTGALKERAVIDRQVRHVIRLVDDLLDVSRIARGKIELKREPVEIAPIVARAIEMASPLVEQKHQVLAVEVPPRGLVVDADPMRLQQVVFNLLSNAAKYTEPHGRLSVAAARSGGAIEIRVRDTGLGIEPAMQPHIFELFVQERQALDRAQGGLGLGLSIVRNLVELHGGAVSVSSAGRGRGSEFVVSLPAAPRQVRPARPAAAADAHASPAATRLRVLIVDDNEDAATFLAEGLALAGFETRTAVDGPSALEEAGRFAPQLALLDLGLPVMDGYELAERLRRTASPPTLVAVTGYGSETDLRRSEGSGFDMHLVKPVDLPVLIAELRRLAARDEA